jgi:hypothetical protein
MTPDDLGIDELPPQLQSAVLEFDAWAQAELLADQTLSTPTGPLYHYTGEAALLELIYDRCSEQWISGSIEVIEPRQD